MIVVFYPTTVVGAKTKNIDGSMVHYPALVLCSVNLESDHN